MSVVMGMTLGIGYTDFEVLKLWLGGGDNGLFVESTHTGVTFIDTGVSAGFEPVLPGTDLMMTGLVDSLAVMDLVTFVSEEAGVKVRSSDITLDNFNTIPGILQFTAAKSA